MANEDICRRCKQPFVAKHFIATVNGTVEARRSICPHRSQDTGHQPEVEMDCFHYIQNSRVGARLRDGYRLLRLPAGGC